MADHPLDISSKISHAVTSPSPPASHCVDAENDSGMEGDTAGCSISYLPRPLEAPVHRRRRKLGRPRKHWTKRAAYQRSFCQSRLRRIEVDNLLEADGFAGWAGYRLTAFVTVRWAETLAGEINIQSRWQTLLNALRATAARRGVDLAYIWVHENPPRPMPAFNTHLLLNWPVADLDALRSWFMRYLDAWDTTAVDVQPRTCPGWSVRDRLCYMVKGTDMGTAKGRHLIRKNGWDYNQGVIPFRRCGTSRNIGRNAREEFSPAPTREFPAASMRKEFRTASTREPGAAA